MSNEKTLDAEISLFAGQTIQKMGWDRYQDDIEITFVGGGVLTISAVCDRGYLSATIPNPDYVSPKSFPYGETVHYRGHSGELKITFEMTGVVVHVNSDRSVLVDEFGMLRTVAAGDWSMDPFPDAAKS